MQQDEFFKIIGIIIFCFFIIYMATKMLQLQSSVIEGLTNLDGKSEKPNANPASSGEAGNASSYVASVKAQVVKMQDELLISKYRKDYEAAIIHLDDYLGYMMLKQALNMKLGGDMKANMETINSLSVLKNSKDALNATMVFLDKQ
jgi:hypothetical protein